ncbi:hypothetical protein M9H77_07550 [Catharanthus roseus]|uniref:Uncharacterized protein n=1 Tax=Catharanthus roseus TaxID=4058 RepID=A0ACC0BVA7_CATRO|nr:hypothetical protein M9H77_07550 [Catharanthus roseus]
MMPLDCLYYHLYKFLTFTVGPAPTVAGRFINGTDLERNTLSHPRFIIKVGDLGKLLNQIYNQLKIHIKVVSEQSPTEWKQRASKWIINLSFQSYGGSNHGHGNFISRGHDGVSNFSSRAKCFRHISYDYYGGYDRDNA